MQKAVAEVLLVYPLGALGNPLAANLMIDYGIGVSTRVTYEIKSIDTDFFEE